MNGLPESPSALPEDAHEAAARALAENPERLDLGETLYNDYAREVVDWTNSGRLEERINDRFEHQLPAQLADISAVNEQILKGPDGIQKRILGGLKAMPSVRADVQAIIDAVCTAPGGKRNPDHRYVEVQHYENAPDWYGIKFRAVERDRELLASLRAANPGLAEEFDQLDAAVDDYARKDPRMDVYNWERAQSGNDVDRSIMHMAKIVIFLAAVAAAVTTGVMSLINRKFSLTPFLYAAVAGLIASPTLRQRLFSGKNATIVAEIDGAINALDAKADAHDYGVSGKAWKRHAEALMDGSPVSREFLRALRKNGPDHIPLETVDAYVERTMSASDPAAREQLRAMILDGRYGVFAGRMTTVRNDEAKAAVLTYIEKGASKLETEAVAAMEELNAEQRKHVPSGFPENGSLDGNLNLQ